MMELLTVKGLLGRYNYTIDFKKSNGFLMLASPNGYGKSLILAMIDAFFSGKMSFFSDVQFDEFSVKYRSSAFSKPKVKLVNNLFKNRGKKRGCFKWNCNISDLEWRKDNFYSCVKEMGFENKITFEQDRVVWRSLSSGEYSAFVQLSFLLFDDSEILLVDGPETGLHPDFQEAMSIFYHELGNKMGKQLVFATHSPSFVGKYWNQVVELSKFA